MKKVTLKKIVLTNFKAIASQSVEVPAYGLLAQGRNESGKSTLLQAVTFALGASFPAESIINTQSKATASVSLTLCVGDEEHTLTRSMVPTLSESGKIVSSTNTYAINGDPKKQGEFNSFVESILSKDWQMLLNPMLAGTVKNNRALLLEVAGCKTEKEFLQEQNPALSEIICNTSLSDFESKEDRIIKELGKRINNCEPRIMELSAMVQEVPQIDLTGVEERIKAINNELSGITKANEQGQAEYDQVLNEAKELQFQAAKLREAAAEKVTAENAKQNKDIIRLEQMILDWDLAFNERTIELKRIREELGRAKSDRDAIEAKVSNAVANINAIADNCRAISARTPEADGNCTICGKWCAELQAKGLQAAQENIIKELNAAKQQGRAAVAERDRLMLELGRLNANIEQLRTQELKAESKLNDMPEKPVSRPRVEITETPESLHLIGQAQDLEATAKILLNSTKFEALQPKAELVEELAALNKKIADAKGAATAHTQNETIRKRIDEIREEERQLRLKMLQHQKNVTELKEVYRNYSLSVTDSVNRIFSGTPYSVKLFDENMKDSKGSPCMVPMVNGSSQLSTATTLIWWKVFVERILSVKHQVIAPILIDNAECVDTLGIKLGSKHQVIIAAVSDSDLLIHPLTGPVKNTTTEE